MPSLRSLLPARGTLIVLGTLVAWTACKNGALTHIELADSDEVVVEKGSLLEDLVGSLGFDSFVSMDLTEAQELQNQGVEPGDISEAFLVEFSLTATSPSGADLSFIDSMKVYVEGPDLPRQLLASASSFDEGVSRVDFDLEDVDLVEYIVSESLTLETEVSAKRPSETTTIKADYVIDVGVTLQGASKAACGSAEE